MSNREYVNELNWSRVGSKSITGIAGSGEIVPHDSHRAIAQLGSRAKVEADRDLDGGGPGPGSSDNLTLDLVSAAAANASSLIKKMTRAFSGRSESISTHRGFPNSCKSDSVFATSNGEGDHGKRLFDGLESSC